MTKGKYGLVSEEQLKNYAELAVRTGVNVQKNQLVIIHSDIENVTFARLIQTAAYEVGASNVVIDWTDEQSTKEFYLRASDDILGNFPNWAASRFEEWDEAGAAYIYILSENFDVFQDVSPNRISRYTKASRTKLKSHHAKIRSHELRWCLLHIPSKSWARKVFPNLLEDDAVESLWQLILKSARAEGQNPIKDWDSHGKAFESRKRSLNDSHFKTLYFTNSLGTDLQVGMPKNHLYIGGGVIDKQGIPFFPNIPTEEIFSAPHRNKVNGRLVASKPLIYDGNIIDNLSLEFKEGKIIHYHASTGIEILKNIIETDEGSRYLGEIALVSNRSPLAQSNTLFYNTLFDENTACHIGIGNASPSNLQNGSNLTEAELKEAGLNTSLLHVNVTFGTDDMKVVGMKEDGGEVLLMKNGDFQI